MGPSLVRVWSLDARIDVKYPQQACWGFSVLWHAEAVFVWVSLVPPPERAVQKSFGIVEVVHLEVLLHPLPYQLGLVELLCRRSELSPW